MISSFFFTSFYLFSQSEEQSFKSYFISTFFNSEIKTRSVYGKSIIKYFDIFVGDSTNSIKGEYGERLPKISIPIKFKIKKCKIPQIKLTTEKECFLYINKYKYDGIIDSIENGLLPMESDHIDSLIWKDIDLYSRDPSNYINLLSTTKKEKKTYYLVSDKSIGMIKVNIKKRDRIFLENKNYSVENLIEKRTQSFLDTFILFCDEKKTEFKLYER